MTEGIFAATYHGIGRNTTRQYLEVWYNNTATTKILVRPPVTCDPLVAVTRPLL